MKGFFGILNLGNGQISKSREVFLSKHQEKRDFPNLNTEQIYLLSIEKSAPIAFETSLSGLYYVGWCRLDNLAELKSQLGLIESMEEPKVILHAYQKWGSECLKHFYGDFSFVIWNTNTRSLFLAKDQLGVRPLFYLVKDDLLIFGTSIPFLKDSQRTKLPLSEVYIAKELKYFPQDVESTFFKDIKRLKPAHFLEVFPNKEIIEKRYWELSEIDLGKFQSDEGYIDLVREQLILAIKDRVRGKKTIACQLSGGMDSSAIAVLLSRQVPKIDLHTYSFVLNDLTKSISEHGIDEKDTQEEVIEFAGLNRANHHEITRFHWKDTFEEIHAINEVFGGACHEFGYWQETMFKDFSEKYQGEVMFSGFPGDEGISNNGYNFFYDYFDKKAYFEIFKFVLEFPRSGIRSIFDYYKFKKNGNTNPEYKKIQKFRDLLNPSYNYNFELEDASFTFLKSFKNKIKTGICSSDTATRMEAEAIFANHHGVEMVFPLADVRLLEIVYSLPTRIFKPKPKSRALFRNVCKGVLPEKIRMQKKGNGAYTLAFYEYYALTKFEQLKEYTIKNHLSMLISEEDYLKNGLDDESERITRINALKEMDLLIELNLPLEYGLG